MRYGTIRKIKRHKKCNNCGHVYRPRKDDRGCPQCKSTKVVDIEVVEDLNKNEREDN